MSPQMIHTEVDIQHIDFQLNEPATDVDFTFDTPLR